MPDAIDPLLLGQRVVAILETGQRVATYKLAVLMALIVHCIENLPAVPADPLTVPIADLAHRVLELYWRQVRSFQGHDLRQSSGEQERIPRAVRSLRSASSASSLSVAMTTAPQVYAAAVGEIGLCLAQQPLHRLQRLPGAHDPFLYDDSFLHANVSRRTLRAHAEAIVLNPGVAAGLARLAGLLKPALEIMWVDDVRRMNKFLTAEVPDIAGHLFGRDRTALAAVRGPFKEAFGSRCFYCDAPCPPTIRSIMFCRGRSSVSTDWPIWCWPARAATPTSVTRCRRLGFSTGYWAATRLRSSRSPRRFGVPPSTAGWWPQPVGSTAASRPGSQHGRGIGRACGWTSDSHHGGRIRLTEQTRLPS